MTEELSEIFEKLEKRVILKQRRRLNVVFTSSELKAVSVSSRTFTFWFRTEFTQTNNKNNIIKNPTKYDFSVNLSGH